MDEFRANSEGFQVVRQRLQEMGVQVVLEGGGGRGGEEGAVLRDEGDESEEEV